MLIFRCVVMKRNVLKQKKEKKNVLDASPVSSTYLVIASVNKIHVYARASVCTLNLTYVLPVEEWKNATYK